MATETVLSRIGLFVSSRCNFNTSILDHTKELKSNAFVGAVFRFSIMMDAHRPYSEEAVSQVVKRTSVRQATRPQVLYRQQHLHKRLKATGIFAVSCGVYDVAQADSLESWRLLRFSRDRVVNVSV